jgi:hypothetical protein
MLKHLHCRPSDCATAAVGETYLYGALPAPRRRSIIKNRRGSEGMQAEACVYNTLNAWIFHGVVHAMHQQANHL